MEKWGNYFLSRDFKAIYIFGKETDTNITSPIIFHNSLLKNRLLAPFTFLKLLFKIKPENIVCTTFELLIASSLYKLLSGKKTNIYYDVIENYSLNLWNQTNRSLIIKLLFVPHIKFREWVSKYFISHYFYSDMVYKKQLSFLKDNSTHLPNYYSYTEPITPLQKSNDQRDFLITGTISRDYGIEKGLKWFLNVLKKFPNSTLKIIGHQTGDFSFIKHENISYNLSKTPISRKTILNEINKADVLLLPYKWTKSFNGCIPSKLYEAIYLNTKTWITYSEHLNDFINEPSVTFLEIDKSIKTKQTVPNKEKPIFNSLYHILDNFFLV